MRLMIALLILFYSVTAFAAGPVTHFERFSLDQGLSQNSVTNIVQDNKGFLWFATQDGLNRYDGYTFKVFRHNPNDPNSISGNSINTLYKDRQGRLWVGTRASGLNLFNATSERFIHFKHHPSDPYSLSHNNIKSIKQDRHGDLWVGTYGGGLNKLDPSSGQLTHYRHDDNDHTSLSHDKVWAIHEDDNGVLWVGTSGGLDRFDPKQQDFSHFRHDPANPHSLSHNNISAIVQGAKGSFWLGTMDGLNHFDSASERFSRFKHQDANRHSLSDNDVSSLYLDSTGILWAGTWSGGLNRYDPLQQRFSHFTSDIADPHSLSNNTVFAIHEDQQGALWIGTHGGGLNKLDTNRQNFNHFTRQPSDPQSLSDRDVLALYIDQKTNLWVGTSDGLNLLTSANSQNSEAGQFSHFKHSADNPRSLSDSSVWAIHEDSQGTLWVGTQGSGLNRYHPQSGDFSHFKHNPSNPRSLSNDAVYAIHQDRNGTLWIGTYGGGLNRYHPQSEDFSRYQHQPDNPHSLSNDTINAIFEDRKGTLWISTHGGLNRFDGQTARFTSFVHNPTDNTSLSHNTVKAVYEDSKGTLWVGTEGGLNKFDAQSQTFKHYRKQDGLPNDIIYAILEDKSANLWLSTNKGLSRFNPQNQTFRNFDTNDGLQSNEFNQGARFASAQGELFFGGINGFNRFFPSNIQDDTQPPPVVLTDFLLSNKSVPIDPLNINGRSKTPLFSLTKAVDALNELSLTHQQNLISFEFAALHFTNPKHNQYAYKLEGQDTDWVYTDAQNRRATFTNIPAGQYTLRIKASNTDGYWNTQGKSLNIIISPPPWKTWWAYSLYGLFIASLIYAWAHSQQKKIDDEHALNLQLERKVAERTSRLEQRNHEVKQKNHEILAAQQQLLQAEKMASLGTLTAGVAHEINNPTNFVHVSAQNLESDLNRFEKFLFNLVGDDADEAILETFKNKFIPLHTHLDIIRDGTHRITTIVQDLRAFTQHDGAEQKIVKITDLLQSTIHLVQTQYVDVATFVTDFTATPELYCYPAELNQVFMNLIVNACDAIEAKKSEEREQQQDEATKGQITIRCQRLGDTVSVAISDNGCGMSKESKIKLFEPFYTTKDVGGGTDLGLSISYGIVQKHGGDLIVESVPEVGTTFRVILPLSQDDL
ncbi:MAG: ligand-binding sensor domain-containing protein/signal transduction histidine kinase [Phenylobacterium sp.]|jgi:ligand-binding sensor domain-containing protein/signal transduction histidine kinase